MVTGHVRMEAPSSLPTGELLVRTSGSYARAPNFHSQFTALTTLAPLAAVEDSIEGGHYHPGNYLSYLLPQSLKQRSCDSRDLAQNQL